MSGGFDKWIPMEPPRVPEDDVYFGVDRTLASARFALRRRRLPGRLLYAWRAWREGLPWRLAWLIARGS